MNDSKSIWPVRLLNQLQGPSSLAMALSGGAVGFTASILNPNAYLGFWTSMVFQMHAGFQLLSLTFGVLFALCRLKSNDVMFQIEKVQTSDERVGSLERLQNQSTRLGKFTKSMIYAQLFLLFAGAVTFIWLMFLYFHRALYPS
jgi:hypothetical protein